MPTGFETCTDHPRLCGGTPIPHLRLLAAAGIIPACGEHRHVLVTDANGQGSSRACGNIADFSPGNLVAGIIPRVRGTLF